MTIEHTIHFSGSVGLPVFAVTYFSETDAGVIAYVERLVKANPGLASLFHRVQIFNSAGESIKYWELHPAAILS